MSVLARRQAADTEAAAGSSSPAAQAADDALTCLRRAIDALAALQRPQGWWKGELETNVTIDAEDLLLREFLGIRTAELTGVVGALDPVAPSARTDVGELPRRPARPLDQRRGLRRAPAGR